MCSLEVVAAYSVNKQLCFSFHHSATKVFIPTVSTSRRLEILKHADLQDVTLSGKQT